MVRVHWSGGFLNHHSKWMQATHRSICMLINNKRVHIFPLCSKRGFSLIPTWILPIEFSIINHQIPNN